MRTAIALAIIMVFATGTLYGEDAAQPPPTPAEEQPEVLTRGPVHEAFAEPVELNKQEAVVAPQEPPAAITENPPDQRPTGDQFVWVPGYWAWDSDRNGYIWVSGCWRAAPPGRYWVPGYWSKADTGWQWVPGFWTSTGNVQQLEYLSAPPAVADVEPPGPPPTEDNIWVPPCWYWNEGNYTLRPGYWVAAQDGWVWGPSHYCWTPRGYVFIAGHWDYSLKRRGVLFAPVYFPRSYYGRAGYSYSLSVAVDIGNFEFGLFTCPRYGHYYFGDYYDNAYVSVGIFPWYECRTRHLWYDPLYEHDRWRHIKTDRDWDNHEKHEYDSRRDNKDLRPPRTYREMEQREAKLPEAKRNDIRMAQSFDKVVADKKSTMKFEPVKKEEMQKISKQSTDLRKFGDDRSRWESSKAPAKSAQPNAIEQKGPSTQPTERKEEKSTVPAEHKQPVTPSADQIERKGPPA
jgi:WXXGXW repeat (2 copies)